MRIIDFDVPLQAFLKDWMDKNTSRFKTVDDMEIAVPEAYTLFNNTPQPFLDGAMPGFYFHTFSAGELVDLLRGYVEQGIAPPDQLIQRISEITATESGLFNMVVDDGLKNEGRMYAINLLSRQGSNRPRTIYLSWLSSDMDEELLDAAAEALTTMDGDMTDALIRAFDTAEGRARLRTADLLSRLQSDRRITDRLIRLFAEEDGERALCASFLARYGDDAALPVLNEALTDKKTGYLDYIEVRNAIEALGGDAGDERNFEGDRFYEMLKGLS